MRFSLGDIIQSKFRDRRFAVGVRWAKTDHADESKQNIINDPTSSAAFGPVRRFINESASPTPNIACGLFIDGENPFGKRAKYAFAPIILSFYNLPPTERLSVDHNALYGIVCGPTEPTTMQPFLKIFVDECIDAFENGITVHDAANLDREAQVRLLVFTFSADYPERSKCLNLMPHTAKAGCHICLIQGMQILPSIFRL